MVITAVSTVEMVRKKFPQAIVETVEFRGEQTIVLKPEHLVAVCSYLQKNLKYTFLSTVTAVDWFERVPRYDVVYHLLSIPHRSELRLKVRVGERGAGADFRSSPPYQRWWESGHQRTGMNARYTTSLASLLQVILTCAAF
jgi:hypothetical protein